MNKVLIVIFSIFLCILAGCSSTPDGVYSESDMEDILYDYYKAKAMGNNLPLDEQYKASLYVQSVFKKYNTTEAEFDSSLIWYTSHPDEFRDVYKKVDERLGDELKNFAGGGNALIGNTFAFQGDTTELWNSAHFYLLSNTSFSRRMNFYLPADTSFHSEDKFAWSFTTHLPGSGAGGGSMTAALCIQYANDSISGTTQNIYSSGPLTLLLDAAPNMKIKAIYGFIYKAGGENGDTSTPYSIALIDRFSLVRQHKQLPKMKEDSNGAVNDSSATEKDSSGIKNDSSASANRAADLRQSPARRTLQK